MNTNNNSERHIGNYRVLAEVSSGAFGSVYLAQHLFLRNRTVAIKLLHATHLSSTEERERFLQEAQFLEMLKHPYILPIIDVGISDGFPYLVAEYASNGSLRTRLRQRFALPLPVEEACTILLQVGQALYYAHQQNIIHRDLKPENILFNVKGEAVLADFGISTMLTTASIKYVNNAGTPRYMAPEQFRGTVSKESDQYALGCIAYELFTGRPPFEASDSFALGFLHLSEPPIPPTQINPGLPVQIEQVILRAIAKQRTDRFADIKAFVTALYAPSSQTPLPHTLPQKSMISSPDAADEVTVAARTLEPGLGSHEILLHSYSGSDSEESSQPSTNVPAEQGITTTAVPTGKTEEAFTLSGSATSSISLYNRKRGRIHRTWFFLAIISVVILASSVGSAFLFLPRTGASSKKIASNVSPSRGVATAFITVSATSSNGAAPIGNTFTQSPTRTPSLTKTLATAPSPTTDTRPILTVSQTNFTSNGTCSWAEFSPEGDDQWFCDMTLSNNRNAKSNLNWTASTSDTHISFFPSPNGTLAPGQSQSVSLIVGDYICPNTVGLTFMGQVNTVHAQWKCVIPILQPSPTYTINASSDCSSNNGWKCDITLSLLQGANISTNWSTSSSGIPGITFSPASGTIAPNQQLRVTVFVPSISCPANATLNFSDPGFAWPVTWNC